MKWYNENKTMMIDISRITFYSYNSNNITIEYVIDGIRMLESNPTISYDLFMALSELSSKKQIL